LEENEKMLKSTTDALQARLDVRSVEKDNLESEVSCLKSRIVLFESECDSKKNHLEMLKDALEEELKNKNEDFAESDGWDLDSSCLGGDEIEKVKEQAKLRIKCRKCAEENGMLIIKLEDLQTEFESLKTQAEEVEETIKDLRDKKEDATKARVDAERRLEILNEYFSKKRGGTNS